MIPNGAGDFYGKAGDCFKSISAASKGCTNGTGVLDVTACATGQATSDKDANYACSADQLKTKHSSKNALLRPVATGSGNMCFSSAWDCNFYSSCNESYTCVFDVTTCSTGVAAGFLSTNWFCPLDRSSQALPNGGGQLCFADLASCHADFNNKCTSSGPKCVMDKATCSTGASAAMGFDYYCADVTPPGGFPNGAGSMCYGTLVDCVNGPNACNTSTPCIKDYIMCGTGIAGPTTAWFNCPFDTPTGGVPDGSGELCYDTVSNCNNGPNPCSLSLPCVLDFPTCATGAATLGGNYRCPLTMPNKSLPQGAGKLCYQTAQGCLDGPNACSSNTKPCNKLTDTCSTGQAAADPLAVYLCSTDLSNQSLPNGAGQFCFATKDSCTNSPNACGPKVPCKLDTASCSTGVATQDNVTNWYCPADQPKGGVPSGSGEFCYDTALDCHNGPNGCSIEKPCILDYPTCATGQAAGLPASNWFCPIDLPPKSVPNGAGQLCYNDVDSCHAGPNSCQGSGTQCTADKAMCATGQASSSGYTFFCKNDLPPKSLPNAFGALCYFNQQACKEGPNACNSTTTNDCKEDFVSCATGEAGPTTNWFICPDDVPLGADMTGGGLLCYDTEEHCNNGPNPCSLKSTCVEDLTTCATGPAAPKGNFVCPLSFPAGSKPAINGRLTYDSVQHCLNGPNACTKDAECANNAIFLTGAAAGNQQAIVCKYDQPAGAFTNMVGAYCYDNATNCLHGPNACNDTATCATDTVACNGPAAIAKATYYCGMDTPVGASFANQSLCYNSYVNCINGPNVCGLQIPCVDETNGRCATGKAKGTAGWTCTGKLPGSAASSTSSVKTLRI